MYNNFRGGWWRSTQKKDAIFSIMLFNIDTLWNVRGKWSYPVWIAALITGEMFVCKAQADAVSRILIFCFTVITLQGSLGSRSEVKAHEMNYLWQETTTGIHSGTDTKAVL